MIRISSHANISCRKPISRSLPDGFAFLLAVYGGKRYRKARKLLSSRGWWPQFGEGDSRVLAATDRHNTASHRIPLPNGYPNPPEGPAIQGSLRLLDWGIFPSLVQIHKAVEGEIRNHLERPMIKPATMTDDRRTRASSRLGTGPWQAVNAWNIRAQILK